MKPGLDLVMKHVALLVCLAAAVGSSAQKRLELFGPSHRIEPLAVASAKIVSVKGQAVRVVTGPWRPYLAGLQRPAASTKFAYDGCEFFTTSDPNDTYVTDGIYGPDCGKADFRWWFGGTYKDGLRHDDMKLVPGAEGQRADRVQFAWYQTANVNDSTTLIVTCDEFATGSTGNGLDPNTGRSDIDAVMISFGGIRGDTGYYFADVDLAAVGLSLGLPSDGEGGLVIAHGDFNGIDLFLGVGQNMMWGPGKAGNPSGPGQGAIWDDDLYPGDGFLDPDELYDYTYGACPNPLGAMLSLLYTPSGPSETLAPDSEQVLIGRSTDGGFQDLGAQDDVAQTVCKLVVPNSLAPIVRVALSYHTTIMNPTAVQLGLRAQMTNGGVFSVRLLLSHDPDSHGQPTYDVVLPDQPIGTQYATYTGSALNQPLSQYVGTDGLVYAQFEVRRTGFSATAAPCVRADSAPLKVSG